MTTTALALFLGPMVAAAVCLWLRSAAARVRVARATAVAMVAGSTYAVARTAAGTVTTLSFGGWVPPFGIGFQVDRLSALFLLLLSLVLTACLATLPASGARESTGRLIAPALFLASALAGAFLTADLFNLFVMFELVLVSSYLLLQASGDDARRAAAPYVVMNVLASLLFFLGAGVLYAVGGSLSLPHLAAALAGAPSPWAQAGVGLLTLAFATKAGLVPLMFWLPRTYPRLRGPIAALFAGMMTKLGVYALLRITPLMAGTVLPEVLVWGGALSAVLAVLAAQAQTRFRDLLSFHVVSQVGFMVVGIGLASVAGLTGAVLYVGHHVLVKTALFLIVDAVDGEPVPNGGSDNGGGDDGGARAPASAGLAVAYLLAGLSLAGLPPLSGFVGKVAVFQPLIAAPRPVVTAILLVASFFTLASVLKIWRAGFLKPARSAGRRRLPLGAALLVASSVLFAVAAGPIQDFARATAEQLLAPPAVSAPAADIAVREVSR